MLHRLSFRRLVCLIIYLAAPSSIFAHDLNSISIPLTFEQNQGQADRHARYLAHAGRGTILLGDKGVTLIAAGIDLGRPIRMHLLRSAKRRPTGEAPSGGFANYYMSKDRRRWISHVPLFSRVRYADVYPGIDSVFRGYGGELEYDFEVAPGSSPNKISFSFEGAERILSTADGGLDIVSGYAKWHLLPSVAYQLHGRTQDSVQSSYQLAGDRSISLQVGSYDRSSMLVIDPVVEYSNFLPPLVVTDVSAAQVDSEGNLFIAGVSGVEVGLIKINPAGNSILYSTHIGSANVMGHLSWVEALALDGNGNAYIAGTTGADDFPTTSALSSCGQSCGGGFVAKFATDGSLAYSAILGSAGPRSIAVDTSGSAYIAGTVGDNSLQTVNAFQDTYGETFFAKLNPDGMNYAFASYFSGPAAQGGKIEGDAIALDGFGNIFVAGETSRDPPLVKPWQSGTGGLFLAQFAPDGKTLLFSTRFGSGQNLSESGPAGDALTGMKIGSDGTVYLVGYTQSQDFPYALNSPLHQVLPSGYGGQAEMFATAIDPTLTKLTYSDYLGEGFPICLALSPMGHLYITGTSVLTILPLKNAIVSDVSTGGFFMELDQTGMPVTVSQYGGHWFPEAPSGLAVDTSGNVYLAGVGTSNFGGVQAQPYFGFPDPQDPILVGSGIGSNTGAPFAKIGTENVPQISLNRSGPF